MQSILEQQRHFHEERERLLTCLVKEMQSQPKSHREKLNSEHRLRTLLDRYMNSTRELKELYEDKDGLRRQDIQSLSGPNEFAEFYVRLKQIKDFHKKHAGEEMEAISVPMSMEFEEINKMRENPEEAGAPIIDFTDEEGYGRFLDLHECYQKYLNLKGVDRVDYLTYLSIFDQFFDIPREKKNTAYREYLETLLSYMEDYLYRVSPLMDQTEEQEKTRKQFEKQWAEGTFPGWGKEASSAMTHSGAHLDLSAFSSWEELASLGLDRLKSALMALGLKCGGTLEQRAQRLWSTKGKSMEELDPSLFAKAKPGKAGKVKDTEKQREIGALEAQIYRLVESLSEQRANTRENVQRKQARTGENAGEDSEEDEVAEDDSDDDEEDIPYNPKNLPLGWDGKPIPFWLYKLHGLNLYYQCEICGNYTYRGPKAFQRHFAEWRHAHGMRCLGIPNTAHFANVTSIEDAIALWQKIKASKESERWKPETEEEYEDTMGNVVSKKTYEDLKRQGLL